MDSIDHYLIGNALVIFDKYLRREECYGKAIRRAGLGIMSMAKLSIRSFKQPAWFTWFLNSKTEALVVSNHWLVKVALSDYTAFWSE
jgi:hypothetical protein